MAHFAHVDPTTNIVDQIIVVADHDTGFIARHWPDPENWIQTSYNTFKGAHKLGGVPLRKNFAGVGFKYDKGRDAFIPPQPFAAWTLDEATCTWNPPKAYPKTKPNEVPKWIEKDQEWVVTNVKTNEVWRQ